jgi:plasmid stability protein
MTITLPPELEATLKMQAERHGTTAEAIAIKTLREKFPRPRLEPRDDWERLVLGLAIDCGTVLSNEALSSEGLYE